MLATSGAGRFTVEAVAERAGCGKATIYRRWPSRARLLLETVERARAAAAVDEPRTGSLHGDLVALLADLARRLGGTSGRGVLPGVASAGVGAGAEVGVGAAGAGARAVDDLDPALSRAVRRWVEQVWQAPRAVLERGIGRGELPPPTDPSLASDLLVGPVLLRAVLATGPIDDAYLTAHVATVLRALAPSDHPDDGWGGATGAAVRS